MGGYFELKGSEVTKVYPGGAIRKYTIPQSMNVEYVLGDHLGSATVMTDSNGNKVSEMRYTPWGEVRYSWVDEELSTTPAYTLPKHTFTGQYSYMDDPSTQGVDGFGLMFYNARFYDPQVGRFSQADTIVPGGVQGLDRYAYVGNNPVNGVDPSGHSPDDWEKKPKQKPIKPRNLPPECEDSNQAMIDCIRKYYPWVTFHDVNKWTMDILKDIWISLEYIRAAFGGNVGAMGRAFGKVIFEWSDISRTYRDKDGNILEAPAWTDGHTITISPFIASDPKINPPVLSILHELGHVFNNNMKGRGTQAMRDRYWRPECPDSSSEPCQYDPIGLTTWNGHRGPEEDFAESFAYTVFYLSVPGAASYFISRERQQYILNLISEYQFPPWH